MTDCRARATCEGVHIIIEDSCTELNTKINSDFNFCFLCVCNFILSLARLCFKHKPRLVNELLINRGEKMKDLMPNID